MWVLFASQVLRSPAPYAEASARFPCGLRLKKLSQNFCERYRYGVQRLAQRLGRQKSPHNLRAFTAENFRISQNSSLRGVSGANDEAISFIKPFVKT
nr:hypothetical protein [uncultured Campylobacter sp.]